MHTGSSSSLSLSVKTKKRPTSTPSPSASKMVCTRRKGTDKIVDPKQCATTFSKRSDGLMKKASALHSLTGAAITLFAFFKGKFCFYCSPFTEGVISELLLPTNPKEGVDWAEKECDSCVIKEDWTSLIMKYLKAVACLIEKLKDFENNPSVNAGAGRDLSPLASTLSYTSSSTSLSLYKETKKRRSAMQTGSSSSLSRKTKKRPSPSTPSPSAPKRLRTRRNGTDKIDDLKKCDATFSKRSDGLTKKASALSSLTGALVSVIVLSPKGEVHSFPCSPLQTSPKECMDWDDKEVHSCVTKEDCASLIMKYMDAMVGLLKKLKYVDHNVAVNTSAVHEPRVEIGNGKDLERCSTLPVDLSTTSGDISTVTDSDDLFNGLEDIADLSEFSDGVPLKGIPGAGASISLESDEESRVGDSWDPEGSTDDGLDAALDNLHSALDNMQASHPEVYKEIFGYFEGRELAE